MSPDTVMSERLFTVKRFFTRRRWGSRLVYSHAEACVFESAKPTTSTVIKAGCDSSIAKSSALSVSFTGSRR